MVIKIKTLSAVLLVSKLHWRQLSDRNFDAHFPDTGNREPQFVGFIGNVGDRLFIQTLWLGKPPQPALCIQQESHSWPPSNAAKISSGKGALKSSGTMKRPRSCPKLARRFDEVRNGTSFAIGTPRFEIMISSPSSTRDKSRERFVLA